MIKVEDRTFKLSYCPYNLVFKEPGGTSRGVLKEKFTYFIRLRDMENPEATGYGEAPVFPGLSKESASDIEALLKSSRSELIHIDNLTEISSLAMGLETALQDIHNGSKSIYFPSSFVEGKGYITINGLIWMGSFSKMRERIVEKLRMGFQCIKIKIGAISWADELDLIRFVRETGGNDLTIRVDANGGFSAKNCLPKLEQLSKLGVHSIEQPIPAGNLKEMKEICSKSPIPVALDEELIGLPVGHGRSELLDYVKPQFVILKPALCFGFRGAADWIERAEKSGIGWWITSALESSVGLDAITQFTARLSPAIPQGLGTGSLFTNNFHSPLRLEGERLRFEGPSGAYRKELERLPWKEV